MRRRSLAAALVLTALMACGDGEDRPGTVTEEGPGSGTGTGSVSGTGTGSASGTGAAEPKPPAFAEAEADTTVDVTLKDFVFVGLPERVKGPKVLFEATNEGPADHELEVVDPNGEPVDEIEAMKAGRSANLAAELPPGTYTVQCLVQLGDKTHADLGMKTTLTVE